MPTEPLLFLDIDGVVNKIGPSFPRKLPKGRGTPLHIPEGTAQRVARLLVAFEPVWATQWGKWAHRAWRGPLGLSGEPWPFLEYGGAKLPAIERFAGDRRWAWVDDKAESSSNGLVISPHPEIGLTDEHVEALLDFALG